MGTTPRGLLPFSLFLLLALPLAAQGRLSADVTIRQVHNGKSIRVEKQLFYSAAGNLVVHYTYPQEYYMLTNTLGEMQVYQPAAGEVMQVADAEFSSQSEFFALFLRPDYADLGLVRAGFALREVKREGKDQIKTYRPANLDSRNIGRVVVVCRDGKPIYSAFYDHADLLVRKVYYSRYTTLPSFTFPTSVTQISYNAAGDSVIKKEEYRNVRTSGFAPDAPFDFQVPANARRVAPPKRR